VEEQKGTHRISRDLVDENHTSRNSLGLGNTFRHVSDDGVLGKVGTRAQDDICSWLLVFAA
jgi:hypothetical protein